MDEIENRMINSKLASTGVLTPSTQKDIMRQQTNYLYNLYPQMRAQQFQEDMALGGRLFGEGMARGQRQFGEDITMGGTRFAEDMARRQQAEAEQMNRLNYFMTGQVQPYMSLLGAGQTAAMGTPSIGTMPLKPSTGQYALYAGEAGAQGVGGQAMSLQNMLGGLGNTALGLSGYYGMPSLNYLQQPQDFFTELSWIE